MTRPLVIGLTGGIGMGKSTAAKILRGFGLPVHNSDHTVHELLKKDGKGVKPVAKIFPEALVHGAIDRKKLGQAVFLQPGKLKKLEHILHPMVRTDEKQFIKQATKKKIRAVILEIPLLFETGAEKRCDAVICVTAPAAVQKKRVMMRPHMTPACFKAIITRQMPDRDKRHRADFVVETGKGYAHTKSRLKTIVNGLLQHYL